MNDRDVRLNVGPSFEAAREIDPQAPLRILICGDFSGRANRGIRTTGRELAARKPVPVDRDNFEEVLAQHDVRLENLFSGNDGKPVSIDIKELDDLHPDRLFDAVDLFESLRALRRRLLNRATFDQAADELRLWGALSTQSTDPSASAPSGAVNPLENLFAETGLVPRESGPDWNRFIRETVASYVVPGADPRQDQFVACADAAISKSMQGILHHPEFQQIEAAWRGLSLLIHRLETDASLKLYVWDVSKEELAADLAEDDVSASGLYQALVEKTVGTPGAKPWGALVGNYVFGPGQSDLALLSRLARIAAAAGAPWLAAAHGSVVGCADPKQAPEFDDWQDPAGPAWQALRQIPEARYLSLIWPRFLLRMPYGSQTSPIKSFKFDEVAGDRRHEQLLWGNGAFLAALALGESFTESGWGLEPDQGREIRGLPWFAAPGDHGDTEMLPCAELWLRDRGAARVTSMGLTPLFSLQGVDAVQLGGLHALNGEPLAGWWA